MQTILFTKDPNILEAIMVNDKNFLELLNESDRSLHDYTNICDKRPPTANDNQQKINQVCVTNNHETDEKEAKYVAKEIKLTLMSNWGQRQLIGLTGR